MLVARDTVLQCQQKTQNRVAVLYNRSCLGLQLFVCFRDYSFSYVHILRINFLKHGYKSILGQLRHGIVPSLLDVCISTGQYIGQMYSQDTNLFVICGTLYKVQLCSFWNFTPQENLDDFSLEWQIKKS